MDVSRQEEIICALWAIFSVLLYLVGSDFWWKVFAVKAGIDAMIATKYSIIEIKAEKKQIKDGG